MEWLNAERQLLLDFIMNSLHKHTFAKDPNKIVFVPAMGKGPIDMVVLDITTGEYQAYDVKSANYRKSEYTPKDTYKRNQEH